MLLVRAGDADADLGQQRLHAVPDDLHADAQHDQRRQPQEHLHALVAEPAADAGGVAVDQQQRRGHDGRAEDRRGDLDQVAFQRLPVVGAQRDGHGDDAGVDRHRQRQRVESARHGHLPRRMRVGQRLRWQAARSAAGASPARRPPRRRPPAPRGSTGRIGAARSEPSSIEPSSSANEYSAMCRARSRRVASSQPWVRVRKIGTLPGGLTTGSSAPTISSTALSSCAGRSTAGRSSLRRPVAGCRGAGDGAVHGWRGRLWWAKNKPAAALARLPTMFSVAAACTTHPFEFTGSTPHPNSRSQTCSNTIGGGF